MAALYRPRANSPGISGVRFGLIAHLRMDHSDDLDRNAVVFLVRYENKREVILEC